MERIVYRKTLDVHKNGIQFTLQGFETADNMARTVEISLMASGDAIDLPLEQISAVMYVTTPKSTKPSINECTIKDNTIVCEMLPIVEEGITEVQLKLIGTRPDGANGILPAPKFAIEVSKSNTDDESATQTTTYTALENALAKAKGVYDARMLRVEIDKDCTFRIIYADGTIYETDVLNETLLKGEAVLSQSYARGGTGARAGEDTDNSMYYSNVSKSASVAAQRASDESKTLLNEMTKHGVYTAFTLDFTTGELNYISPLYSFSIDSKTGELKAKGEAYNATETVNKIVTEWLESKAAAINASLEQGNAEIAETKAAINAIANELEGFEQSANSAIDKLASDHNESVAEMNSKIGSTKSDIADLRHDVQYLDKSLSDFVEVVNNNLAIKDNKIQELENASASASEDISNLNLQIEGLSEQWDSYGGVIGELLSRDHIIQKGTINGWKYERWYSGKVVCWLVEKPQYAPNDQITDSYYTEMREGIPKAFECKFPFTFTSVEHASVDVACAYSMTDRSLLSVDNDGLAYQMWSFQRSTTPLDVTVFVEVKGTIE